MSVQKAELCHTPSGLPGQAICLSAWFHHVLDLFHLVFSRFHMRGGQHTQGAALRCWVGSRELSAILPWLLQVLRVPGSASKSTELRGGVPQAASKFHENCEFLKALLIFFQPVPESYLNLTFAGCSSCSTRGTLRDGRSWSFRVQQDVFSFAVERRAFISVEIFKPRSYKG